MSFCQHTPSGRWQCPTVGAALEIFRLGAVAGLMFHSAIRDSQLPGASVARGWNVVSATWRRCVSALQHDPRCMTDRLGRMKSRLRSSSRERDDVVKALFAGFGGPADLFVSLWRSNTRPHFAESTLQDDEILADDEDDATSIVADENEEEQRRAGTF